MTKEELIGFETEIKELWERGEIKCPIHLSGGNEEELIEIFKEVKRDDYVFSTHRNHYHYLLHGGEPRLLRDEILRKETGLCRGLSGSMCTTSVGNRFYSTAIVGGGCGIAVGVAWALKDKYTCGRCEAYKPVEVFNSGQGGVLCGGCKVLMVNKGRLQHVWCFVGDGALDGGHFWESWQYALGWDLPITFVVEDNDRSTCTTTKERLGLTRGTPKGEIAKQRHYTYKPTYPHVGSGKYVQF